MPRKNIPHEVDELADKLRKDKSFYPERSEEDRTGLAYAVAWKQHHKKHPKTKKAVSSEPLTKIAALADYLDDCGLEHYAEELTNIMYRLSEELTVDASDNDFILEPGLENQFELKVNFDPKTSSISHAVIYDKLRKESKGNGEYSYYKVAKVYSPKEVHATIDDYINELDQQREHNSKQITYFNLEKTASHNLKAIVDAIRANVLPKNEKYSFEKISEQGLPVEITGTEGYRQIQAMVGTIGDETNDESIRFMKHTDGFPIVVTKL